jgi:hypothetical protein
MQHGPQHKQQQSSVGRPYHKKLVFVERLLACFRGLERGGGAALGNQSAPLEHDVLRRACVAVLSQLVS